MHQKYGMTHAQLVKLGDEITDRNMFRMGPYFGYITVVTSRLQWDAVTAWLAVNGGSADIQSYGDDYETTAGYALRTIQRGSVYCLLGVHRAQLTDFSTGSLSHFVNILSHEIQHCVTYLNEKLGLNAWHEEEPHAYLSGDMLEKALDVIRREWQVNFISAPYRYNAPVSAATLLPPTIQRNLTTLTALSGMIDNAIASENGKVYSSPNGWVSTTFFTGGQS